MVGFNFFWSEIGNGAKQKKWLVDSSTGLAAHQRNAGTSALLASRQFRAAKYEDLMVRYFL